MKKIFALAAISALALMGCDSQEANAQTSQSATVGSPDSANVLIVEEGYEVVAPVPSSINPASSSSSGDWSEEGNVEVAPLPNNQQPSAPASGNNNNAGFGNSGASSAPNTANSGGLNVDESVMETATPDSATYDMDETISN